MSVEALIADIKGDQVDSLNAWRAFAASANWEELERKELISIARVLKEARLLSTRTQLNKCTNADLILRMRELLEDSSEGDVEDEEEEDVFAEPASSPQAVRASVQNDGLQELRDMVEGLSTRVAELSRPASNRPVTARTLAQPQPQPQHLVRTRALKLRIREPLAPRLLEDMLATYHSAGQYCQAIVWRTPPPLRKEAATLARMLDLGLDQLGQQGLLELDLAEVLLRRIFALQLFNEHGNWHAAEQVEEVGHGTGIGSRDLYQDLYKHATNELKLRGLGGKEKPSSSRS